MNSFYEHHRDSIHWHYRCFDRILLNGLIQPFQQPERVVGFFNTSIGDKIANRWHLQIANRWVVQYNFYINDRHWGRMFVRMCPYFPFSARICLNQHHWLANRLRESGVRFKQLANAFLTCAAPDRLQALANSLIPRDLVTCGQKWLAHLTPFFTAREREEAGCRHRLFFSQVEFCDNLVFRRRSALDKLGERLLDANRTIGQPKKITVIFGRKITKHYRGKLQTEIEDMNLPNPVIRSHYGNGFIKQYVRGSPHPPHRICKQQRQRLWRQESGGKSPCPARDPIGDQRQLSQRAAGYSGDLCRSWPATKACGTDDHGYRKAHSGPQARSPSATRPDACARPLRAHRGWQYLHHCRNPPRRHRSPRLRPQPLHTLLASL